jgi:diguanylate cyclase
MTDQLQIRVENSNGDHSATLAQEELEAEFRAALQAGDVEAYFQPIIDIESAQIYGVEMLARWPHATRGLVSPGVFVPLAVELGLTAQLTISMLESAADWIRYWHNQGRIRTAALNISAKELLDARFVDDIAQTLQRLMLPVALISVEINQTALLDDLTLAAQHIERLHSIGCTVALDDYSPESAHFKNLSQLPIYTLKIDRSLVNQMNTCEHAAKTIATLINTAQAKGLHIIAEGVESEIQAQALSNAGCNHMQGYFFAHPKSGTDFNQWLEDTRYEAAAG